MDANLKRTAIQEARSEIASLRGQVVSLQTQLQETERQRAEAVSLARQHEEFIRDISGKLAAANEEIGKLKSPSGPTGPHDPRIDPKKGDRILVPPSYEILVLDRTPEWVVWKSEPSDYPDVESLVGWQAWTLGAEVLPRQEEIP